MIEYPHTQHRHKLIAAEATVKAIDVAVAPGLSVGYIMGVGDQVPAALQQLGVNLSLIDPDELAWGDLSKYHTIMTGVRAYERRADLRANNHRLVQYVENGGTVVVQYNKMEFNQAQYGPYPAQVSNDRITDENAPVKVLVPAHPVFTSPNRIDESAWQRWVQERGLYFLGTRDAKYVDLVEMEDPFEYNKGAKRGALVEARHGKGRWLYVGLGLWRQLPAGTDGAYKLMANLVSLGKAAVAEATQIPTSKLPTSKGNCSKRLPWDLEVGSWELDYFSSRIFPRINPSSASFSSFAFDADSTSPPASRTPLNLLASMSKATK